MGNSTEGVARLMEAWLGSCYPEIGVRRVHSLSNLFRYDEVRTRGGGVLVSRLRREDTSRRAACAEYWCVDALARPRATAPV